jgi:uncharacterized protein YyaL (SSP411 family)
MLYDGPQLASVYVMAYQLTGDMEHALTARGVLDYLMRDMTHPRGGLFSAEVSSLSCHAGHLLQPALCIFAMSEQLVSRVVQC